MELSGDPGNYKRQVLLKWDLSSLTGQTVVAAQVVLSTRAADDWGNTLPLQLTRIDAAWSETGVTWNTQPAVSAVVSDTVTVVPAWNAPYADRTWTLNAAGIALVQSWIDGGSNYGVKLAPVNPAGATTRAQVHSREVSSAAVRPRLIVTAVQPDMDPSVVIEAPPPFVYEGWLVSLPQPPAILAAIR